MGTSKSYVNLSINPWSQEWSAVLGKACSHLTPALGGRGVSFPDVPSKKERDSVKAGDEEQPHRSVAREQMESVTVSHALKRT